MKLGKQIVIILFLLIGLFAPICAYAYEMRKVSEYHNNWNQRQMVVGGNPVQVRTAYQYQTSAGRPIRTSATTYKVITRTSFRSANRKFGTSPETDPSWNNPSSWTDPMATQEEIGWTGPGSWADPMTSEEEIEWFGPESWADPMTSKEEIGWDDPSSWEDPYPTPVGNYPIGLVLLLGCYILVKHKKYLHHQS